MARHGHQPLILCLVDTLLLQELAEGFCFELLVLATPPKELEDLHTVRHRRPPHPLLRPTANQVVLDADATVLLDIIGGLHWNAEGIQNRKEPTAPLALHRPLLLVFREMLAHVVLTVSQTLRRFSATLLFFTQRDGGLPQVVVPEQATKGRRAHAL